MFMAMVHGGCQRLNERGGERMMGLFAAGVRMSIASMFGHVRVRRAG